MSDTNPTEPKRQVNEEMLDELAKAIKRALDIDATKTREEREHTAFDENINTMQIVEFLMQSFHHMSRHIGDLDHFEKFLNEHGAMVGYFLQRCKEKSVKLPARRPLSQIIQPPDNRIIRP